MCHDIADIRIKHQSINQYLYVPSPVIVVQYGHNRDTWFIDIIDDDGL